MAEEIKKEDGLKEDQKETGENQSNSETNASTEKETLKNTEEVLTPAQKAAKLLDGTLPNKEIKVDKDKFDDQREKAKLYETHASLLDKVLKDPKLVEDLLETKEKGDLGDRMTQIEEDRKTEKRNEIRNAVT